MLTTTPQTHTSQSSEVAWLAMLSTVPQRLFLNTLKLSIYIYYILLILKLLIS